MSMRPMTTTATRHHRSEKSKDSSVVRSDAPRSGRRPHQQEAEEQDIDCGPGHDDKDPSLPQCKIRRNYSCTSCVYFTQNPRHFLYHVRDVHKEKLRIYECPNCLYASKHYQKLLRHSKMVHGGTADVEAARKAGKRRAPPPEEEQQEEEAAMEVESEAEEQPEDEPEVFQCSVCSFTARNQAQLNKHERDDHIKTKFFRCSKCSYVTHMKARFTKHVKYHSMPMIKCDMCDFRTPYKWNLDRHCKNHSGRGAFRCSACNFTADIKQSLTVHEMNHHVPPVGQAAGLGVGRRRNKVGASDTAGAEEAVQQSAADADESVSCKKTTNSDSKPKHFNLDTFGSDFIDPDDIIQHASGNIYIKNKCKLCNFKTAWDSEMAKHERRAHDIFRSATSADRGGSNKKPPRPVPNLIPLSPPKPNGRPFFPLMKVPELAVKSEPTMSQQDINDICAKSANSALRDFASLFSSEDVFEQAEDAAAVKTEFKEKNASFFDKLKEKLLNGADGKNLVCQFCGHESKCLSEAAGHQKLCGKHQSQAHHSVPMRNTSSTRCQHCRQRCKSSADLHTHLQTCGEAFKSACQELDVEEIKVEPDCAADDDYRPHPMENRVFVWNNIEVPLDVEIEEGPPQSYDYLADVCDRQEDNVSLDLSLRTHSPESEHSYLSAEPARPASSVPEKIPTHGNDISVAQVAQHKRVFKCPHCSFWASTASRFHVHIVGHLNKKPFECSLCAYRSNWRWDITKHIKLKSVRDPAHERAKVLMTDETGRRNYTKYNKYLTEIPMHGDQNETSGGAGTRHKAGHDDPSHHVPLPKLIRAPTNADFGVPLKMSPLRPPPPLKAAEDFFNASPEKKKHGADARKTLWQCKKCNFRDASHEKLLAHVKGHYREDFAAAGSATSNNGSSPGVSGGDENDEASENNNGRAVVQMGFAPFRCGHCHQVSNWKHVIQRHCRLKHSGDIRVLIGNRNGSERLEVEEQVDEPDHVDLPQTGTFRCKQCPFSNDDHDEFETHLGGHFPRSDSIMKCYFCTFFVSDRNELYDHLLLHGIGDPRDYVAKVGDRSAVLEGADPGKRHRCLICPYVTNNKSQFLYHKKFHKPRGGQYNCTNCNYNVSKRHLLHQHLKVHGISITPAIPPKQASSDVIDVDEMPEEGTAAAAEELLPENRTADISLVWVSKAGKFAKMFKCRYCPHVNLRKVNIQEHEKMHGVREKANPKTSEVEHHCPDCTYVCNNAGVLSSHFKVHQGIYGKIHCLVDATKTDNEQIRELSRFINLQGQSEMSDIDEETLADDSQDDQTEPAGLLHFCGHCPARFLKQNEHDIHVRLHNVSLIHKCDHCSYTAREKLHLLAHSKVHTFEYQERTRTLQTLYGTSSDVVPLCTTAVAENGELIWVVVAEDDDDDESTYREDAAKAARMTVPISGTDLFRQRSEAQQRRLAEFGTLMHGNPDFVYPTCLKNGRTKEKRYKCHKCPSAFEKREQYKVHLTLHGAKQRYRCDHCDYSVKYYANYIQHLKKHRSNTGAEATEADSEDLLEESGEETPHPSRCSKSLSPKRGLLRLSVSDQQALMIMKKRRLSTGSAATTKEAAAEEKKLHWCPSCPYTNFRKDAVDNHQKRHISVSGFANSHTCEHCDYSVPQAHFLREHTKVHFVANKVNQPEGYMVYANLQLTSRATETSSEDEEGESKVIFADKGDEYFPRLDGQAVHTLNNNEAEKAFVNMETGEVTTKSQGGERPPNDAAAVQSE